MSEKYGFDYLDQDTIYFRVGNYQDRLGSEEEAIEELKWFAKLYCKKSYQSKGSVYQRINRELIKLREYKIYYENKSLKLEEVIPNQNIREK